MGRVEAAWQVLALLLHCCCGDAGLQSSVSWFKERDLSEVVAQHCEFCRRAVDCLLWPAEDAVLWIVSEGSPWAPPGSMGLSRRSLEPPECWMSF